MVSCRAKVKTGRCAHFHCVSGLNAGQIMGGTLDRVGNFVRLRWHGHLLSFWPVHLELEPAEERGRAVGALDAGVRGGVAEGEAEARGGRAIGNDEIVDQKQLAGIHMRRSPLRYRLAEDRGLTHLPGSILLLKPIVKYLV